MHTKAVAHSASASQWPTTLLTATSQWMRYRGGAGGTLPTAPLSICPCVIVLLYHLLYQDVEDPTPDAKHTMNKSVKRMRSSSDIPLWSCSGGPVFACYWLHEAWPHFVGFHGSCPMVLGGRGRRETYLYLLTHLYVTRDSIIIYRYCWIEPEERGAETTELHQVCLWFLFLHNILRLIIDASDVLEI